MRLIVVDGQYTSEAAHQALHHFAKTSGMPKPNEVLSLVGADTLAHGLCNAFSLPFKGFEGPLAAGNMVTYATDEDGSALLWVGDCDGSLLNVATNYDLRVVQVPFDAPLADLFVGQKFADPRAVLPLKDITPAEPYIFPQSHSSLNVFETCPRQYESKYITRDSPYVQSAEAAFGDVAHNGLEAYVKAQGDYQLASNIAQYKPFADWVLQRAAAKNGVVYAERMSAVDRQLNPVAYKAKNRWIGGKIDITIVYPDLGEAEVFDWKTGKVKNDQTQLQLYGALGLADFPEVKVVRAGYIWLAANTISPPSLYSRADYAQHWDTFEHKYRRLQDAYRRGVFEPKPNGLCKKWCDVKRCEFHGQGRR